MNQMLKNCWEIKNCGRENGGPKVNEFGECIASKKGLGHSCWIIAGTLCGGEVQGTAAQKENNCFACEEVYRRYTRIIGLEGQLIHKLYPEEQAKYNVLQAERASSH